MLSHPRGCSTWDGKVTSAVGCVHRESERDFNQWCAWCTPSNAIQTLTIFKTPVSKAMLSLQGQLSSSFTNIFSSSFIAYRDDREGSRACFSPFLEEEIGWEATCPTLFYNVGMKLEYHIYLIWNRRETIKSFDSYGITRREKHTDPHATHPGPHKSQTNRQSTMKEISYI